MKPANIVFILLAASIIVRLFMHRDPVAAMGGSLGVLVIGSMIWFRQFWIIYVLPFGFWEARAKDFKNPQASTDALVLVAWVLMLVMAYFVYFTDSASL